MMLKIIGSIFYLVTFLLLLSDTFHNPSTSLKYFLIDSRVLYLIFITTHILVKFINREFLFNSLIKLNNYLIFPLMTLIFIPLAVINGFTNQFFAFNTFGINLEIFKYLFYISGFVFLANIKVDWLKTFPQKLLYFGGILYLISFNALDVINPQLHSEIIKEDGLLENIQAIFYFTASLVAIICSYRFSVYHKKTLSICFLILALGLFFIAGEEISWGQRILNMQTPPEYAKINLQEELTVHNIEIFQSKIDYVYMLIGLWGAFSAILFKKLLPKIYKKYQALFPQPILFFYFFAVTRFYFLNKFVVFNYTLFSFEKVGIGDRQEISETLLAFGFLAFTLLTYTAFYRIKKS